MFTAHRSPLVLLLLVQINFIASSNISACIPNTPCQCYLTQYSFTLYNCSHALGDVPIFDAKNIHNITRIIARNAFHQWPVQLCKYSNIQILDLSGSNFRSSSSIDFSCLNHLIHLNLSNTQIKQIPKFQGNASQHLQILDLSNNYLRAIDGQQFRIFKNLISLFLQNNPIQSIEHLEDLLNSTTLQSINLHSSSVDLALKQSLTINQWIDLADRWSNTTKSLVIRMNHIPFQSFIPSPDEFDRMSTDSMKSVLRTLIDSTFVTLFNTPKCDCVALRTYQRMFSFVDYPKKYSSPLFQSVKCVMFDGITHARVFDRRTTIDLRCTSLGRKLSLFPSISSSSTALNSTWMFAIIFSLVLACWIETLNNLIFFSF